MPEIIETTFKNSNDKDIYLKFDTDKYDIQHRKNEKMIVIKSLKNGKVIKEFSDKEIGFLIQCTTGVRDNFLVGCSLINKNVNCLEHYVYSSWKNNNMFPWYLKKSFKLDTLDISKYKITDRSYIIFDRKEKCFVIYNLYEEKTFSWVYTDKETNKYFNDDTILVTKELFADYRYDIKDNITYGINPETFEITTPIWSDLQQRFINVCTKEPIKNDSKLLLSSSDKIIYLEIVSYLNKLAEQIEVPKNMYGHGYKLEDEFIRKFVKNTIE